MNNKAIKTVVLGATKKWTKQRKAEERQASRAYNRQYAMTRSYRTTIKDVAFDVMEEAYNKASGNGQYPANARQIMYAARPAILAQADNCNSLKSAYFIQTLLPQYMEKHPDICGSWDVIMSARGHFNEPHTKKEVGLGTLEVRKYLNNVSSHTVEEIAPTVSDDRLYPTMGPRNRYSAILFIEKEGFHPLFEAVHLAEKYDIAIMSTKGMSVTAARQLIDTLCADDVPLLVLHDFDKAGFSILGTLQRDTRRYTFSNYVNVIDLGIRFEDIEQYNLQSEDYNLGESDPTWNLRENGATEEEIDFLFTHSSYKHYSGKRVELNAFTSGDFIEWIESKLKQHGIKKVVPDSEVLADAYRRAVLSNILNDKLESFMEEANDEVAELSPQRLTNKVKKVLKKSPEMSWDEAIARIAENESHE